MRKMRVRILSLLLIIIVISASFPVSVSAQEIEKVNAGAALLVDVDTGKVLYEQNSKQIKAPASTTKIMTALLVLEAVDRGELSLDMKIKAKRKLAEGVKYDASHVSPRVKWNEILTLEEYLYCILVESDCACCDIVADQVSGSVDGFVELMNTRAKELGCTDTVFVNTHGYPAEGHVSTAWDLYLITAEAMKNEKFREIVSTQYCTIPKTNLVRERKLYNSNWLLGMPPKSELSIKYDRDYKYDYCIGVKTGYSSEAGSCLVSYAYKDGRTLCCIILGAWGVKLEDGSTKRQSFTETVRLFEWGFDEFEYRSFTTAGEIVGYEGLRNAEDTVPLVAVSDSTALVRTDSRIERKIVVRSDAQAPVSAGDVVGDLYIKENGTTIAKIELAAVNDVEAIVWQGDDALKTNIMILAVNGAVLLVVMFKVLLGKKAKRKKRRNDDWFI